LLVIVSRYLGPENRGSYFLVILAATIAALVLDAGVSTASLALGASRRVPAGELHGLIVSVALVGAGLAAAVVTGAAAISRGPFGVDATLIALAVLAVGPLVYVQAASALLIGLGRIPALSTIRLLVAALAPVVMILTLAAAGGDASAATAAWFATTALLAAALAVTLARAGFRPTRPRAASARRALAFGARGQLGTVAHLGFLRLDVIVLGAQSGTAAVGQYSLASTLAERVSTLGAAAYGAGASRVGGLPRREATELTARILRALTLVLVLVSALLALGASPLIPVVFGNEFSPAVTPFLLLLPGTVALTLWYIVSLYIVSALGRPGTTTIIQGIALAAAVPLYYVAVGRWGMAGAATASSAVYMAVLVAGLAVFVRSSGAPARILLPRRADVVELVGVVRRVAAAARRGRARA
jgi:O-antigen/teichoic acid export membrane protein